MKLHEMREVQEVELIDIVEEDDSADLEEDLSQALKLLDELLPHFSRYVTGRMFAEPKRSKAKQRILEDLVADVAVFLDQWTVPQA